MILGTGANKIFAFLVFIISLFVYVITLEPTVSFWDCGEFISCIYKLQVSHQPGAPLFTLFYRIFTLFASSPDNVAVWSNAASAFCGAITNMLIFLTITYMGRKISYRINKTSVLTKSQLVAVIGAGLVGSFANAFSDTFWFSAVETEVYEMSSMFTALVFWLIIVWEEKSDGSREADKLIVLIAYLMGLSIGVHLLNLLTIPAIGLVIYFKKYKPSVKGFILTILLSLFILCFVQYIVIQKSVALAAAFDYMFVNVFRLPFLSGSISFFIILIAAISFVIYYSHRKKKYIVNIVSLCLLFIVIGYSSFTMIVLRAQANPPLNNSSPTNAYDLLRYLNRDQYGGSRPLLYGPYFDSKVVGLKNGGSVIDKVSDKYEKVDNKIEPIYNRGTIFPRIYSTDPSHQRYYRGFLGISNEPANFVDNIKFYFQYQLSFMYLRYFFWNFVGRQNDIQGYGGPLDGNFITGFKAIDSIITKNSLDLPPVYKENSGYNKMYALPLILGIIGFIGQFRTDKKNWAVIMALFLMMGFILSLYLNHPPLRPRERDYFYVGSFSAFCIWIGLGSLAIYNYISAKLKRIPKIAIAAIVSTIALAVPLVMFSSQYDDHNRAGRYTTLDIATNYLMSCEKDAILFTYGDNDTYPLWYCQEVEGIRPDVRVVNLSLLGTDWYGRQMKYKMNESAPLPLSIPNDKFRSGLRDYIQYYDAQLKGYIDVSDVIEFITDDSDRVKLNSNNGQKVNFLPTKKFRLPVDKQAALENIKFSSENKDKILSSIEWEFPYDYLYKNDMLVLDILANNKWRRPIYFSTTVPLQRVLGLQNYFRNEGFAYRLVPIKSNVKEDAIFEGYANTDILYNNMMNKFKWTSFNDKIYLDPESRKMADYSTRGFIYLAQQLIQEGKTVKALKVLDKMQVTFPDNIVYDISTNVYLATRAVKMYYQCQAFDKGDKLAYKTASFIDDMLSYYAGYDSKRRQVVIGQISSGLYFVDSLLDYAQTYSRKGLETSLKQTQLKLQNKFRY